MSRSLNIKVFLVFTLLVIIQSPVAVAYNETIERRISIGLRLFRTLLAADNNLEKKTTPDNQLKLLIISAELSNDNQHIADELFNIGRGAKKGKIHGIPITISIITAAQLSDQHDSKVAGIYIADKLSEQQLQTVINFGVTHHAIVYSPFEGDVQNGVPAGLAVGVRVLPFININSLEKSQITIKALILKVAKIHED